jgi:hypothetical protein
LCEILKWNTHPFKRCRITDFEKISILRVISLSHLTISRYTLCYITTERQRRPVGSCSGNGIRPTEELARMCARICVMDGRKNTRNNQRNFRTTYGESTLSRRPCILNVTDKNFISKSCIITELFTKLFYIIFTNIRHIILLFYFVLLHITVD